MKFRQILVVALVLAFMAGCGGPADDVVRIGVYASLTGATATFGQSMQNGVKMAIEEANADGGLNGKPFKLYVEDDQSKAEESKTVVTKLITLDKVCAVIGSITSSNSLAAAPFCQQSKVPMISPASTNPKVTEIGDYIFRVCFIDPFQGSVMAKFTYNTLKAHKVAIFIDRKSDYSDGLARYFRKTFTELGGEVVAEENYIAGDQDFKAQLTAIKAANPEAIFVPGYYTEVGLIGRQARELGITVPLLGGDGWNSPRTVEIAGDALEGCYFSDHFAATDPRPAVQSFIKKYEEKYGERPDAMAPLSYDAAGVLVAAIRRAGTPDPKLIRDELAATKDYEGVGGTITIDDNRNAVKSAVVVQIQGPEFVHVATIEPES